MFEIINNLLSEDEKKFLQDKCDNFKIFDIPNAYNDYVRNGIDTTNYLLEYQIKVIDYLYNRFKLNYKITGIWINKVSNETNKSDDYHHDVCNFTIITYLNDNFENGEFVYFDENNKQVLIKPKKDMCIIQNNKLRHKVNPVTNGVRYSLITFINFVDKDIKTLL